MNKEFLIEYLKHSIIESDNNILNDKEYNPDSEILENIIRVSLTKINPNLDYEEVETFDNELISGIVLFSKKELFFRLACKSAPLYSFSTKEHSINKSERFNHYCTLINIIDSEITEYINSGGATYISTGEVLINSRYFSERNYNLSKTPKVDLNIDYICKTHVDLTVKFKDINLFNSYSIYVVEGKELIYDKYTGGLNPRARLVNKINDIKLVNRRLFLDMSKGHTIAIKVSEKNGSYSFKEKYVELEVLTDA